MKIFRWSGFIGFVVFTALMMVIGFLFIDGWAKKGLEVAGFQLNGAEVNVGSADLTLSPLGFTFENIDVANADKPTHNVLSVAQMSMQVNFPQLFLGNVRIEQVTVTGIESDTERARVAKLPEQKEREAKVESAAVTQAKSSVAQAAAQFPEPESIVSQHTEHTQMAVDEADATLTTAKQNVEASVQALPGDAALADYKQRIANIKSIELDSLENIQQTQSQLKSLSRDVAQDKVAIEAVKLSVNNAVKDSKNAVNDILDAPANDWQQLKSEYPLNKESAMKVAQLLLGETFFQRIEQAQYWYAKAKPWLARLRSDDVDDAPQRLNGEYIRFAHPNPTAKFQLDQATLSFLADNWPWEMTIEDLTSHTGKDFLPTLVNIRRGEAGQEALTIAGRLDKVDGQSVDTFELLGRGVAFANQRVNLAGTEVRWQPEKANVSGQVVATAGELDGKVTLTFPSNQFTTEGDGTRSAYVGRALATIKTFAVTVKVSGTLARPRFNVTSDLDNRLSDSFSDIAKQEYDAWLKRVRGQLDQEVAQLKAPVEQRLAQLESRQDEIEQQIKEFEGQIEQEIRSLEDKVAAEQQRLEGQAAAELEALQLKAEDDKRKAEEAAKKAAEDKLKEEADKLKGKLKF